MVSNCLCMRNKYGHCKFAGTCRYRHNNTTCEATNCELRLCENRHPKECFWFRDFGWCKFTPCHYKHSSDIYNNTPQTNFNEKLKNLGNLLSEKDTVIENQRRKLKIIEEKVDILEKKLTVSSFKCEHCEYESKNKKKLKQHVKKNHPGVDLNVTLEDDEYKELQSKVEMLASNIARIQEAIEEKEFDYNDKNGELYVGETF